VIFLTLRFGGTRVKFNFWARAGRYRLTDITPKSERKPEHGRILVLGIGGAGNDVLNRLIEAGITRAECVGIDTDLQQLKLTTASQKVLIGRKFTRGLGTGSNSLVGRAAIEESKLLIENLLRNVEVVFIVASLGGGTGMSAAPIVAQIARRNGAVTVGVVTTPLKIEKKKVTHAALALNKIRNACDTVVVIDSNKFVKSASNLPINEAFKIADQVSANTIKGIVDSISTPSLVNLDFADFRAMVRNGGLAMVSIGESAATNRAEEAVRNAFKNPLLDVDYAGATGALVHISGDSNMEIEEAKRVGTFVTEMLGQGALVKFGARTSPSSDGFLKVTLVMTGVRSPKLMNGVEYIMPKLFDIESSYSEPEKQLQVDLSLDQIEKFE
jgi:cell division protein FtsZ